MQQEVPYSQAIALKYPEPVAIAIAKDPQGKCNPISLGWSMCTSGKPPMMAVSIGLTRYSLEAFRHSKGFVLAFPSEHQGDETMLYGTRSGRDCDKLGLANAKTQPAKKIDCVLLSDAVANFECKLVGELRTGDHVIFAGEVVCSHINETALNRLYTVAPGHTLSGLPRGRTQ
jgi:flavin reductase (DIM6/NTAB) family NADH-FMN oxidoreductase RutF